MYRLSYGKTYVSMAAILNFVNKNSSRVPTLHSADLQSVGSVLPENAIKHCICLKTGQTRKKIPILPTDYKNNASVHPLSYLCCRQLHAERTFFLRHPFLYSKGGGVPKTMGHTCTSLQVYVHSVNRHKWSPPFNLFFVLTNN